MISKNESFEPPQEHEKWANNEFSNVLDYASEHRVEYNGSIFIEWLAVPFISLWYARHTKINGYRIWFFHNMDFTDHLVSEDITDPRDVLAAFVEKWESNDLESLRVRNISCSKEESETLFQKTFKMVKGVEGDDEIWSSN